MKPTESLLRNFIQQFADQKVAGLGQNGKPAFRDYQFATGHAIFETLLLQQMRDISVRFARQMGKTELVGISCSAAAFYVNILMHAADPPMKGLPFGADLAYRFPDGMQLGIFAPREDTGRVDYGRIRRILRRCMNWAQKRGYDWRFDVDNELKQIAIGSGPNGKDRQLWNIEVLSAAPSSSIESRSFNGNLFEECQDIEESKIVDDIKPMGAASRASNIYIGVIGDKRGFFDKQCDLNAAQYPENHFQFDYTVGIEQEFRDGAYAEYIQREIQKFGADSESFRKMYKLQRVHDKDQLMTEETFINLADIHEHRWEQQPLEIPEGTVLVAGLDIARDYDRTVLKIATADWRNVRQLSEQEVTMPRITLRWQKSYEQKPHDEQFAEILFDLTGRFPGLRKYGSIAFDATGDRGDYSTKLASAGFNTIPVIFTGGVKPTIVNDRGEVEPGSKSHMCIQYVAAIDTHCFSYAADEKFMGSLDYWRRRREQKPEGTPTLPPAKEYQQHKAEAVTCERKWQGHGRLNLEAPKKSGLHDDQIDADLLTTLAAIYFRPIDLSRIATLGQQRTFSPDRNITEIFNQIFS